MRNPRRRRFVPRALRLEPRRLLANFSAAWLGQTANMDLTGPTAAVGPDGTVDDEIQLTTPSTNFAISYVQMTLNGYTTPRWESWPDLDGYSNAEVIDVSGASGKTYNVFFNPTGQSGPSLQTGQGQQLTVNVYYHDQSNNNSYSDSLSLAVGASNPGDTTTLSAPTPITWNGFTASWAGQQSSGVVDINVSGLSHTIMGAFLSDQVANGKYGSDWYYGTLTPSSQSGMPGQNLSSVAQSGTGATLSFNPDTNEAGSTMTLRLDFGSYGQQATQFLGGTSDPGLATSVNGSSKIETPGNPNSDFLQTDANAYGTIYLSSGTYTMNEQLVLNDPVTIEPMAGATATLVFTQPQQTGKAPVIWPDAVEIKASHVTLENFSIRFSGSFLWTTTGGFSTGAIHTYGTPSDITITGMNIQGPTQSLFGQATDPTASIPTSQTFADTFTSNSIGPGLKWTALGGSWNESGGTLTQSQVSRSGVEKVLVNSTTPYPGAEEIEANVLLTSISGDGRAGVSLDNNSSGQGYNLVFHDAAGGLAVQLLNDGIDWSTPVYNNWQTNHWYTFQLVVVPQGGDVDALFGKVWPTGATAPGSWTIEGLQGGSDYRSPRLPALEGGSNGATAEFKPVNGQTGSLVWAVTPPLLSAVDSTRWQAYQGSWTQTNGVLEQSLDHEFRTSAFFSP